MKSHRAAHLGPEKRRPAVLDTAMQIALDKGLRGVSMEGVAQQLSVTKPVIYACFSSREELLNTLLEREQQRLLAGVMSALPELPDFRDPEQVLIKGFQALLRVISLHRDAWQLVFAAEPDPAIADRYQQARQFVASRVGELMRPGLEKWQVKDIDRKLPVLVEMFMSAGDGAVRALLASNSQWSPDELGTLVGRMVLGALRQA